VEDAVNAAIPFIGHDDPARVILLRFVSTPWVARAALESLCLPRDFSKDKRCCGATEG
jgi:hypothetical protein